MRLLPMCATVLCCLVFHHVAIAGAWMQPEDQGMALLGVDASSAHSSFNNSGDVVPRSDGEFRTLRFSGYWEYGLNTRWTSFGQMEGTQSQSMGSLQGASARDIVGGFLLGLRRRVAPARAHDQAACSAFIQCVSSGSPALHDGMTQHTGFGCNYAYAVDDVTWLHAGAEIRWAAGTSIQSRLRSEYLHTTGAGKQWSLGVEQRLSLHHGAIMFDEDRTRLHARVYLPFSTGFDGIRGWWVGVEQDVAGRLTQRASVIAAGIAMSW